jgi:putative membrane protein
MASARFTDQTARADVAAAIREVESVTSAEIVVAVRPRSGHYRHTDYLVGFGLAFVALLVFLFDSHEFSIDWMPVDTLVAFAIGTILCANVPPLRRFLTSKKVMLANVRTGARAAFVSLGISRTSGRSGILVYASMFEKRVEVVPDIGIDAAVLGPSFAAAVSSLDTAVRRGPSFPEFLGALRSLGPILAKALPRLEGDVNELPDEPST